MVRGDCNLNNINAVIVYVYKSVPVVSDASCHLSSWAFLDYFCIRFCLRISFSV